MVDDIHASCGWADDTPPCRLLRFSVFLRLLILMVLPDVSDEKLFGVLGYYCVKTRFDERRRKTEFSV